MHGVFKLDRMVLLRAACVQMCHAIERVLVGPTPAAVVTRLDLSSNAIGDAGAVALAALLQVCCEV